MRKITRHIIHASASPNKLDVGVKEIDRWHKERGWSGCGYHNVIRRNGVVEQGRDISQIGAHVAGHNKDTIGTCLVGAGTSLSDFTSAQLATLERLDKQLKVTYPGITTHGHREYANKLCPGFNVSELPWLKPAPKKPLTLVDRFKQTVGIKKA
jgi:N-acetylmuramoyl-L-alanine amidase